MKIFRFSRRQSLSGILIVGLGILGWSFSDPYFEIQKNVEIYLDVLKTIQTYYVDRVDHAVLVKKSIDEMLKGLDPYTVYYPEADVEDYRFMNTGDYGSVGLTFEKKDKGYLVTTLEDEAKSVKGLIYPGDMILKVEGQTLENKSTDELDKLLKGSPGTAVRLLVKQIKDGKTVEKLVVREKFTTPNVPYYGMLDNQIGYIRHTGFTDNASYEVKNAVRELKAQGAVSIVLDLRGNPGGLLHEAVKIVNIFIPKGEKVVSTKGKLKEWNSSYSTPEEPLDTTVRLAVIVNSHSASAAEIVSGSLQDFDRAVVVGQRSYGKGLVQNTMKLSYNAMMKVTISKYYIPSGRCIQALDYSNRNPDGSVGKVPDSLVTKFYTKHNRPVYDGGGVLPDIITEAKPQSLFVKALMEQRIIFGFLNQYYFKSDSISDYRNFAVSATMFQEFSNYLHQTQFSYESESAKALATLKQKAEAEKYESLITSEIKLLEKQLVGNIDQELKVNKEEISRILKVELCARWGYGKGRQEASMANDTDLEAALAVLRAPQRYKTILNIKE